MSHAADIATLLLVDIVETVVELARSMLSTAANLKITSISTALRRWFSVRGDPENILCKGILCSIWDSSLSTFVWNHTERRRPIPRHLQAMIKSVSLAWTRRKGSTDGVHVQQG